MSRIHERALVAVLVLSLGTAVCAGRGEVNRPEKAGDSGAENARMSIGTATMLRDGTIVLDLRAEAGPSGPKGDARLTYPPGHPQYREILEHVGGLHPGETRNVPPWTDE
jgi:hypothetical protein